jgi:hypothetical protein
MDPKGAQADQAEDVELDAFVESVADDVIRIGFHDASGDFYYANVPAEKYKAGGLIGYEGEELRIKSAKGSAIQFIPKPGAQERYIQHQKDEARSKEGMPQEPTNWSDREQVETFLGALDRKYSGINWRKGARKLP